MRTLIRSLGAAVVLTVLAFGAGASPAAAAAPAAALRTFVEAGFTGTTDAEYEAWAQVLAASTDGPLTPLAATTALAGTNAELRAFVDGGYLAAWNADERLRVARVLAAATGPAVRGGAQTALNSTDPLVWSAFLRTSLALAQNADNRLMAATMLTGGLNNSGPALDAAAQIALAGTADELADFLLTGQFTARAIDAAAVVPAQPAAPAAPAPAPAAPAAPAAAPAARGAAPAAAPAQAGAAQLAATGPVAEAPVIALASAALLTGAGLVLLARRHRHV